MSWLEQHLHLYKQSLYVVHTYFIALYTAMWDLRNVLICFAAMLLYPTLRVVTLDTFYVGSDN